MRVICTVESMNYSACGLDVGDRFELSPDAVTVPDGTGFCFFAIQQVVLTVHGRLDTDRPDEYLSSCPLVACPDPPEAVRIRVQVATDPTPTRDRQQ